MIYNNQRIFLDKRNYLTIKRKAKSLDIILPDFKFGRMDYDPILIKYLADKFQVLYYIK